MTEIPSRSHRVLHRSLVLNIVELQGSELYPINGFSGSLFHDAYGSVQDGVAVFYYFTGIHMKNMAVVPEIVRRLYQVVGQLE